MQNTLSHKQCILECTAVVETITVGERENMQDKKKKKNIKKIIKPFSLFLPSVAI